MKIQIKIQERKRNGMDLTNWPSGLKHTKQRGEVLELLENSDTPLSAADIMKQCGSTCLSTVYRILDSFEEYHMVEKVQLPSSDTSYYKISRGQHTHYATCLGCHRQIPLSFCPIESLRLTGDSEEFVITGHKLELYGYCRACMKKKESEQNGK